MNAKRKALMSVVASAAVTMLWTGCTQPSTDQGKRDKIDAMYRSYRAESFPFDAVNLKGSILPWVHAGQELVDDTGPTRRVHVHGREWGLLPAGYEPVW